MKLSEQDLQRMSPLHLKALFGEVSQTIAHLEQAERPMGRKLSHFASLRARISRELASRSVALR